MCEYTIIMRFTSQNWSLELYLK